MVNKIFKRENLVNNAILFFAIFPLIPNNTKGLPVILLFLAVLLSNIKKHINWKWLLINSSLFLTYLISLSYTENFNIGLKKLETGLSILIIPIIFFGLIAQHSFNKTLKTKFFKFFIFSSFCFSAYSLFFIVTDTTTNYYSDWYTNKFRVIVTEMPFIGQHPIYASIFLSISVIFFVELIKNNSIKTKYVYILFTSVNVLLLLMIMSKGVVLGLLLSVFIGLLKNFRKSKFIIISLICVVISLLVFNRRVKEIFKAEMYSEINENFSTSIRVGIYKCAIKVIGEEFILGYGIGDSQRALNLCYSNYSNVLLKNRYNSHNQYLDIFIKTGFFGFFIFLYFLYMNFIKACKNENKLMIILLIFYCVLFLTENILVRQSGVILFFFLLSFLSSINKTNSTQIKTNGD